ncbi:HNH endonuclease [Aerococcus viridans]
MPTLRGDWFHSRTGSQLSELAAIQLLVKSSHRTEYIGKGWGVDRRNIKNKWIYDFSATAKLGNDSIEPSTMQTKIRNWIRLGFLVDRNTLPLEWTQMGLLWNDAVDNGRGRDANLLYQLIIANALSTVSFSTESKKFDLIPQEDGLLITFLINEIKNNGNSISRKRLELLADGNTKRKSGKNYSYWATDLNQSGLFNKHRDGSMSISYKYENLLKGVYNYSPDKNLPARLIKEFPLAENAPFRDHLIAEFKKYGSDDLIEAVNTLAHQKIYLSHADQVSRNIRRKTIARDTNWSKDVKISYQYKCAIPNCDAEGRLFIQAAHIMPHSEEDIEHKNKHRTDLENGVALCLSCHKLFDGGLFTFDSTGKVIPSKFIYSSELLKNPSQNNVVRILESKNKNAIRPLNGRINLVYIQFHKENIFLGE